MTTYRRGETGPWEELAATAAGVLAGAFVFYLARVWLQRERLPGAGREPRESGESPERDAPREGVSTR